MGYSAKPLSHYTTSPAPEEWKYIKKIRDARPQIRCEMSLQKIDGTNICVWMVNDNCHWYPYGDYFYVHKTK